MENFEKMMTASMTAYETAKSGESQLDPSQKPAYDALHSKMQAISEENNSSSSRSSAAPSLGDMRNMACLAQTLTGYLVTVNSRKNQDRLRAITARLYESVNLWLSRLFRFNDASSLFHDQDMEGFVRLCHMLLNFKFKKFQKMGYQALSRQPAIYVSAASKYAREEYRQSLAIQVNCFFSH